MSSAPLHMKGENFQNDPSELGMSDVFGGQTEKLLGSWGVDVAVRGKCICGCMSIGEMHVLTFESEKEKGAKTVRDGRSH